MVTLKRILILFLLTLTACSGIAPTFPAVFASPTPLAPTATPDMLSKSPPTATAIPMAITVNGEGITADELNAELARYKAALTTIGKTVTDEQALQAVRADIVSQFLLAQAAAEGGFVMDATSQQQRLDALISKIGGPAQLTTWEQAHGYTEASFGDALKRAALSAWMRDKIMSSVPSTAEQVHVRQILLYNKDVAKSYYDQLQAGADFEVLAAQVDPVTRGDIGWFPRGYLAEKAVEDTAFSLAVGAYSAIVASEVGFHIIKLLDRQPERGLSPDALSVMQNRALNDWLATRFQQSSIAGNGLPVAP